jgi:outer membrane immunogenic protein
VRGNMGNMKKSVLTGLAFGALIMPAMAADIPPDFRLPLQPPFLGWTGLYIGANAGWIGSWENNLTNLGTDTGPGGLGAALALGAIPGTINVSQSGFIGGGQIGYNWRVEANWVLGVEADFEGTSAKSSASFAFPGTATFAPITTVYNREIDSLGTFRARAGYLSSPGLLWYVTGGLAYGQTKLGAAATCPAFAPPCSSEGSTALLSSNTSVGWTLGGGAEWQFLPGWSVKAEYLYVDLGNVTNTITYNYGAFNSSLTSTLREQDQIVRVGFNYKLF